jgi:hypothetical protein
LQGPIWVLGPWPLVVAGGGRPWSAGLSVCGGGSSSAFGRHGSRMLERRLQAREVVVGFFGCVGSDENGGGRLRYGEVDSQVCGNLLGRGGGRCG